MGAQGILQEHLRAGVLKPWSPGPVPSPSQGTPQNTQRLLVGVTRARLWTTALWRCPSPVSSRRSSRAVDLCQTNVTGQNLNHRASLWPNTTRSRGSCSFQLQRLEKVLEQTSAGPSTCCIAESEPRLWAAC